MSRLHQKLSLALLAILIVMGAAFYAIDRINVRLYYEELTQRLNASLAMYIANSESLITNGVVANEALSELAGRAMTINPTAAIYLLDTEGRILGHILEPDSVVVERVPLAPIETLMSDNSRLPVRSIDPRNPASDKVFSVAPVYDGEQLAGYLYVVLGGAQYEAIADQAGTGYAQRLFMLAIVALVLSACAAGFLVVRLLTSRLRRLTRELDAYTDSGCADATLVQEPEHANDEIAALRQACRQMAATIDSQMASLHETDRLRRELVTNVSHDLRTPLASMQGYIETLLIKDEKLSVDERRKYLRTARRHAERLSTLVQDLFELARLDSNSITPRFERFDLAELVHDVVQDFKLDAEKASVHLQILQPPAAIPVNADIGLIQRVLENLVANALRFTPPDGSITIAIDNASEHVGVSVADTGQGIRAEDLPRIFDRFYRSERGQESLANSTGLGLAIAKRILELHGSQIEVRSRVAEGTRFDFHLPSEALAA